MICKDCGEELCFGPPHDCKQTDSSSSAVMPGWDAVATTAKEVDELWESARNQIAERDSWWAGKRLCQMQTKLAELLRQTRAMG